MPTTFGKLEGRITVPAAGWTGTINDSDGAGAATWTVVAGDYYLSSANTGGGSSFITAFSDALNTAAPADTITVTIGAGENGTGKVTITSTGSTAITWTSTDCRNLLGFTGDLSANTTWTGSYQARSLWLPTCSFLNLNGGNYWRGWIESDLRIAENMAGYVWAFAGQRRRVADLAWQGIKRRKCWVTDESTVRESFEQFYIDVILGEAAWSNTPAGPIRFYPDAATDTVYGTYRLGAGLETWRPDQLFQNYAGQWVMKLPRMIQVPGTEGLGVGRETITYTALTNSSSTADGTSFATSSITATANELVLAGVLSEGATPEAPTLSGGGLTWVQVATLAVDATRQLTVFRALGASPSAGAITITFSGTQRSCAWSFLQYNNCNISGNDGEGAIVQYATGTATATSLGVTLASLESANNRAVAFVGLDIASTVTPDADFTERTDSNVSANTLTLEVEDAANQTNCTATFSSCDAGMILVEIKAG